MPLLFLPAAIAGAGVLHILADARKAYRAVYLLKPLTVLLIIALAATRERPDRVYHWAVLGGLAFSLAGDIFLMLRNRRFTAGLACFLIALLFYNVAFFRPPAPYLLIPALGLLAYGIVMDRVIGPRTGKLRPVVALYLAVLLLMMLFAVGRWLEYPAWQTGVTAAGAALFVLSDSLLAFRQFRGGFPGANAAILLSYYAAQTCIALG